MCEEKKIDLKERLKKSKKPDGWVSFVTGELSEDNLDEIACMADKLEKIGFSLEISRKKGFDFVVLKVNEEKYRSVISRNAGRKADFEEKYDKYAKCTVEELRNKLKTTSKTKIAQELGCSRMTLYRILSNIEQRSPSGDTSIWHYTS